MSVLIKGGRVVTAADDYVADVFVDGERVTLIGESLDIEADRVIDATGKYLLPGGVDPHTHLDMPFGGTVTIDDVESGQTAAAFGGTTTPRRLLHPGQGPDVRRRARRLAREGRGQAADRHGLPHRGHRSLGRDGALEELATLPDQGVTSYKLFMAYKGALQVDDETLFRTMEVAAVTGALVMVHAENGDAIDVLVKQALAERPDRAALARADPPARDRGRGDEPRDPARARRRLPAVRRPRLVQGVGRADRARAAEGLGRLGRDVHAVLLRRLHVPRAAELRGREVRLHAAAARQGEPGGALGCGAHRRPLARSRPTTAPSTGTARRRSASDDFSKIPNGGPGLENRLQMIHTLRRPRGPDHAEPDGRAALDEPGEAVRPLPAQGHARGRLGRGHRRSSTPRSA